MKITRAVVSLLLILFTALSVVDVNGQALDRTHIKYTNPLQYGATCTAATLNATITAIGSANNTLFITATDRAKVDCTWTLSANVTFNANTVVYVPAGATLSANTGITVTFNGPVFIDRPGSLTGLGTFIFNDNRPAIYVSNYATFQAAVDFIGSQTVTLIVNEATTASATRSLPATLQLQFTQTGKLNISTGVTITYLGSCQDWPLTQHFTAQTAGNQVVGVFKMGAGGTCRTVYPQWWGAVASGLEADAATNTYALKEMSKAVQTAGQAIIIIPPGQYYVGVQYWLNGGQQDATVRYVGYAYQSEYNIRLDTCTDCQITILGYGATFIWTSAIKNASWNPTTQVPEASSAADHIASTGDGLIEISKAESVTIKGLTIHGNRGLINNGALWSGVYYVGGTSIQLYDNKRVMLEDLWLHHNIGDGLIVAFQDLTTPDDFKQTTLINVKAELSGRNGFSLVGGRGVSIINSSFNYNGEGHGAAWGGSPGAGIDIEPEGTIGDVSYVYIANSEFIDNTGFGIIGSGGTIRGVVNVHNSLFIGTTTDPVFPAPDSGRGHWSFYDSRFYGSTRVGVTTGVSTDTSVAFYRCTFSDAAAERGITPYLNNGTPGTTNFVLVSTGQNVIFQDTFVRATRQKAVDIQNAIVRNMRIEVQAGTEVGAGLLDQSFVIRFTGSSIEDLFIYDSIGARPAVGYYIDLDTANRYRGKIFNNSTLTQGITWTAYSGQPGATVGYYDGNNYITAYADAVSFPATATYGDATSISLTEGVWDISAVAEAYANGATVTLWILGISTTSGNSGTGLVVGSNSITQIPPAGGDAAASIPIYRVNISATTVYYMKMRASYTVATPQLYGRLSARRVQ